MDDEYDDEHTFTVSVKTGITN